MARVTAVAGSHIKATNSMAHRPRFLLGGRALAFTLAINSEDQDPAERRSKNQAKK
jgi:hypothetical protein